MILRELLVRHLTIYLVARCPGFDISDRVSMKAVFYEGDRKFQTIERYSVLPWLMFRPNSLATKKTGLSLQWCNIQNGINANIRNSWASTEWSCVPGDLYDAKLVLIDIMAWGHQTKPHCINIFDQDLQNNVAILSNDEQIHHSNEYDVSIELKNVLTK